MSLSKSTIGDDFVRTYNIRAKKPKSGYTALAGDLVVLDFSITDGVDKGAADENMYGIVLSINSSNGTLSVAELTAGVTIQLEYSGTDPALGQKIECTGAARGTLRPDRDICRVDNTNGVGAVVQFTPTGTNAGGTLVARFP